METNLIPLLQMKTADIAHNLWEFLQVFPNFWAGPGDKTNSQDPLSSLEGGLISTITLAPSLENSGIYNEACIMMRGCIKEAATVYIIHVL